MRDLRFGLVLSEEESQALQALAERERITQAAVLRRLLWQAAQNLPPANPYRAGSQTAHPEAVR